MKLEIAEAVITDRLNNLSWERVEADLDTYGGAILKHLLTPSECAAIAAMYADDRVFRSRIVMARHGFGSGEYKYFAHPLPDLAQTLRTAFYSHLVPIANEWQARLGLPTWFPPTLKAYLAQCHAAGQTRPTPLLLRYKTG